MRIPLGLRAAAGAGEESGSIQTIIWQNNYINTGSISNEFFTATEATTSAATSANTGALPTVTTDGWYIEWEQVEGWSAYVNFVGVANTTSNINWASSTANYTSWYWSGSKIFGVGDGGTAPGRLSAGTHRLAVRSESGSPKIYFMRDAYGAQTVTGPHDCPTGTLYFITHSQGGYKIGDVTIVGDSAGSGDVYAGGGGCFPVAPYYFATIDAVEGSATGTGTYSGSTGNTSQSTYRHAGFTGSAVFEWTTTAAWTSSDGFFGIMDLAHWNGDPDYNGSTGERIMPYMGQTFSYGSGTGTTLITTGVTTAPGVGATVGIVWNESNGRLAAYYNGVLAYVFQNTGLIGQTKYPAVSEWTADCGTTMRTTVSSYASSYTLP
jgi:hypothetical protein